MINHSGERSQRRDALADRFASDDDDENIIDHMMRAVTVR